MEMMQQAAGAAPRGQPHRPWISQGSLVLLALLMAFGYIALALCGWGQLRGFFANPARVAVCGGLVVLAGLTPLCGCNVGSGVRHDLKNNWIFLPLLVCGLLMGWAAAYSDRHSFWTFHGNAVRYAGLTLFLAGMALRIGSILILGARFTVCATILHRHELVTDGLYRFARHPSYTGALFTLFGWALVFRSGIGVFLAAAMIPPLISRMKAEERLLDREFGSAYEAYRARTWRLLPRVY
jgi:protein-S-isoprenylcysteine O-methyltransferase Ste14